MQRINLLEFLVIVFTLFFGMVLVVINLPAVFVPFKPNLLVLSLFYISLYMPNYISIWGAWLLGLVIDNLDGFILGNNALQFAILATLSSIFYRRIKMYSVFQQGVVLFVLYILILLVEFILVYITKETELHWLFWARAFITAFCWPLFYLILSSIRQKIYALMV